MIFLHHVVLTTEAFVLAGEPAEAERTLTKHYLDGSIVRVVKCRAELAPDGSGYAAALEPLLGYISGGQVSRDRSAWTCAQWSDALRDDLAAEAARLREEAAKSETMAARLRAKVAELEAMAVAQPKATATLDPALDGDAKTTTGPREDFAPLHPNMFGGTDYPDAEGGR